MKLKIIFFDEIQSFVLSFAVHKVKKVEKIEKTK